MSAHRHHDRTLSVRRVFVVHSVPTAVAPPADDASSGYGLIVALVTSGAAPSRRQKVGDTRKNTFDEQ
jgi:hypothetical protein